MCGCISPVSSRFPSFLFCLLDVRAARRGSDSGDSEGSGDGGNGGNGEAEAAPVVGPAVPAGRRKKRTTSERDGNADGVTSTATPGNGGGSGGGTLPNHFPVSHEVVLEDMTRAALCVAFDPSGARVACGGNSYELNIYTFGTMGRSKKRTKATMPEPEGGHPVRSISYGYGGAVYAVATTSNVFLISPVCACARLCVRVRVVCVRVVCTCCVCTCCVYVLCVRGCLELSHGNGRTGVDNTLAGGCVSSLSSRYPPPFNLPCHSSTHSCCCLPAANSGV